MLPERRCSASPPTPSFPFQSTVRAAGLGILFFCRSPAGCWRGGSTQEPPQLLGVPVQRWEGAGEPQLGTSAYPGATRFSHPILLLPFQPQKPAGPEADVAFSKTKPDLRLHQKFPDLVGLFSL